MFSWFNGVFSICMCFLNFLGHRTYRCNSMLYYLVCFWYNHCIVFYDWFQVMLRACNIYLFYLTASKEGFYFHETRSAWVNSFGCSSIGALESVFLHQTQKRYKMKICCFVTGSDRWKDVRGMCVYTCICSICVLEDGLPLFDEKSLTFFILLFSLCRKSRRQK